MGLELRLPKITGTTDREQLTQVKSYLYQLTEQLQWALNNFGTAPTSYVVQQIHSGTSSSQVASLNLDDGEGFNADVAFDSLKPYIIKSADIVQAYYEQINTRLASKYVAESDFGTFIELNEQNISKNATDIEQTFSNIQKIITDIENLEYSLLETKAHIKSGLLYYDGATPIYGLEIGQKNTVDGEEVFNKFARFTSDRLSFYDQNNSEVAYISDYKLYIRNVEITSTYKIGGFVDTVMSGDVVTKWVGGR